MYGSLLNAVEAYNLRVEHGERSMQKQWRFRHLESLEGRIARAVLHRVNAFIQSALFPRQARARSVSERVSY